MLEVWGDSTICNEDNDRKMPKYEIRLSTSVLNVNYRNKPFKAGDDVSAKWLANGFSLQNYLTLIG